MTTLLVDSRPAVANGQAPSNGSVEGPEGPAPQTGQPAQAVARCSKCAAPMAPEQEWCTQCGAGAHGSLGTSSWRPTTAILATTLVLVLAAAGAAYAALSKGAGKGGAATTTVARVTPATTSTPSIPGGAVATPPPAVPSTPAAKSSLPLGSVKPPKIPLTAVVPKTTAKTTAPSGGSGTSTPTTTTPPGSTATGGADSEESTPTAILLDTDAASTYNPYSYPASGFGDPSLAIDGDTTTAWTAKVDPATAPRMAQGLLIDLKDKQRLSAVTLITSTPGMTVQVYGANGHTAPTSITDPAWVALSRAITSKKKHIHIALRDAGKTFTFVTLWISKAPQASIGTPEAPGHVSVNELELFPAH
jgi:hypothetical protein